MGTELVAAEARRAERATPHPGSMDLYFQGMAHANRGASTEYIVEARGFSNGQSHSIRTISSAMIGKATVDARNASYFLTNERGERLAAAEAALTKVLSLAP